MKRKIVWGIILTLVALVVWQHKLLYYVFVQAKGQLAIVWEAKPLNEYLQDAHYPDSLKAKIQFVQQVKTFAYNELGINPTDNYSSMYDQHGQPAMWVVTACEPFALEAATWKFPVMGEFPYKGFFKKEMALKEIERMKQKGYDVDVRNPGGWSTLGWFNDPILSEMLNRSYGQLAELIIHELTHSTIFVKDSVTFNENLASFIGHRGTIQFLTQEFSHKPEYMVEYMAQEKDSELFVGHFIRGAQVLDSLYIAFYSEMNEGKKLALKEQTIQRIINAVDTLQLSNNDIKNMFQELPNNAYFMSFLRYRSMQTDFESELNEKFDGDLRQYITYYKENYPSL